MTLAGKPGSPDQYQPTVPVCVSLGRIVSTVGIAVESDSQIGFFGSHSFDQDSTWQDLSTMP